MERRRYRATDKRRGTGVVPQSELRRLVAYVEPDVYDALARLASDCGQSNSTFAAGILRKAIEGGLTVPQLGSI